MSFDRTRAEEALGELARQVVFDDEFADARWTGIALVIRMEPEPSLFGVRYTGDEWRDAAPADGPTLKKARSLADAMKGDGDETWKSCLIQIAQPGPTLKADFDYENPERWALTPANRAHRVEELRP